MISVLREYFAFEDQAPSWNQLYLVFRRFDKDNDGFITFEDFCYIFMPTSQDFANVLAERQEFYISR